MNNDIEMFIDDEGNKYYVLNNNSLDLSNKNIISSMNPNFKTFDDKDYYKNKLIHREDGPAIEYKSGTKNWYKNGKLHREDGPAMEVYNGDKNWYKNGLLHREDGPARESNEGYKEWYLNDEELSEIEYKKYLIQKEANFLKANLKQKDVTKKNKI